MQITNRLIALLLVCASTGFGACASDEPFPEPPAPPSGIFVTRNGDQLSGWMNVEVFHVPEGQRVVVTEDFSVHATKYICIEGELAMQDRSLTDPRTDAPDLRLASDAEILVTGRIIGGAGRSFGGAAPEHCVGQPGGDGSSILMLAPRYLVLGALVAGKGGRGGAGERGGAGGSIEVIGDRATPEEYVYIDPRRFKHLAAPDAGFYGGAGGGAGEAWNGMPGQQGRSGGMSKRPWTKAGSTP